MTTHTHHSTIHGMLRAIVALGSSLKSEALANKLAESWAFSQVSMSLPSTVFLPGSVDWIGRQTELVTFWTSPEISVAAGFGVAGFSASQAAFQSFRPTSSRAMPNFQA